ncbi:hypothetical protein ZWY2020_004777 [Hordeum vulgare]|nr:hypothetical protein ZWY2020_004777 [Hordeum vulgare]
MLPRSPESLHLRSLRWPRGFSSSSARPEGKADGKIVVAVVFERLPVVIPKIHPVVYDFQEFLYSRSSAIPAKGDKKQSAQNTKSMGHRREMKCSTVMTTSKDAVQPIEAHNGDVAKKYERDEKLGCACKDDVHGLTEPEPENHRDFSGLGHESWDRHDFLR